MSNRINQSLLDSMQNLLVLLDKNFLKELDEWNEKELFVRIISLDFAENPRSEIQGYATGGSINVDGSSAVRRTCNLNIVTSDTRINQTDWALESKFKLEIGLRNFINPDYPDIIWFPQGVYILTSFSSSINSQGFTISLQGKDKMCLLDGSVGGNLFATHDFGKLELRHDDGSVEFEHILIYDIIRNAIHEYALEPYENIIINDLEDCSVELLNYMAKNKKMIVYESRLTAAKDGYYTGNIAFEGSQIYNAFYKQQHAEDDPDMEQQLDLLPGYEDLEIGKYSYRLVKEVVYGDTVGYRLTDLTYAGDLILNAGSTITQMLDALVNMLGEFEYYYDLNGRFIFQRKKIYYNVSWTNAVTHEKETYYDSVENGSENAYSFVKGILIESYNNKPELNNIKNDYTIWGQRVSGNDNYPIHIRCAIDDKPLYYKPIANGNEDTWGVRYEDIYNNNGEEVVINKVCDWRELIYQMAVDYQQSDSNILRLNKEISSTHLPSKEDKNYTRELEKLNKKKQELQQWENTWNTNYVAYYTDLLGFWRLLYDPDKQEWNNTDGWNPDYIYITEDEKTKIRKINIKNHEGLIFWFDFIDDAYLEKYKPSNIGRRTKVINDNDVKGIFFEETPNLLFIKENELDQASQTLSYIRLNLTESMTNYFRISTQGKSAKEVLDNLLYQHTYYCESITLNCIPIYYLQPNTRIEVYDEDSGINGEYIIKSYNIQLNHNGSMSITATKAEELIL